MKQNLAMEYTLGIASGVPVIFISVGDENQDGGLGGFLDLVNFLLAQPSLPQVLTTGFGQNENEISGPLAKYVSSSNLNDILQH